MFNNPIYAVHLLCDPSAEREQNSIRDISRIADIPNVYYQQIVNEPYKELPPAETCKYPERIGTKSLEDNRGHIITSGTYGCFMAHTDYIMDIKPKDDEIYLIFESDAKLAVKPKTFIDLVRYSKTLMDSNDIDIFNFGAFMCSDITNWTEKSTHIETDLQIGTHCYMILKQGVSKLQKHIKTKPWEAYDFWLSSQSDIKFGVFREPLCVFYEGKSLVEL